jgi:hypothetical protein
LIKALGIAATVIGIGASLLSDYVGDKKLDGKVEEQVAKALAKQSNT